MPTLVWDIDDMHVASAAKGHNSPLAADGARSNELGAASAQAQAVELPISAQPSAQEKPHRWITSYASEKLRTVRRIFASTSSLGSTQTSVICNSSRSASRSGSSSCPHHPTLRPNIEQKLLAGQHARRSLHRLVSSSLLAFGLISGTLGQVLALSTFTVSGNHCWKPALTWAMACLGLLGLSLAPGPEDGRLTHVVVLANVCWITTQLVLAITGHWNGEGCEPLWHNGATPDQLLYTVKDGGILCTLVFLWLLRTPVQVQSAMWRCFQFWLGMEAAMYVVLHLATACPCMIWYLPSTSAVVIVSSSPTLRNTVRVCLARLYDRHGALAAAASLAELMGDWQVNDVVRASTERFRCIRCDQVTRADLASRDPDPTLHCRSTPARLGSCDAFVSHSWWDGAQEKWEALQQWRDSFVTLHAREPTIWLDKFCVDQTDIESDLRCLPVFLSGCKEMVVLCGPSYLGRLWCIMELFIHNHMGSGNGLLTVLPVLKSGRSVEDLTDLVRAVDEFDVQQCQCSRSEDREQIVGIIMAAFGSTAMFNKTLKDIIGQKGFAQSLGCDWGSNYGSSEAQPDEP